MTLLNGKSKTETSRDLMKKPEMEKVNIWKKWGFSKIYEMKSSDSGWPKKTLHLKIGIK